MSDKELEDQNGSRTEGPAESGDTVTDDAPETVTTAVALDKESATEDSEEVAPEPKSRLRTLSIPPLGRTGRIIAAVAAGVAVAASLASSVYFYRTSEHDKNILAAQADAREAACKYAPVLVTYDAKNLDAYFSAVLEGATGDWRTQFDSTSKDLRDVLTQGQVVAKANDVQCAIRSGDEDSAEAIVVIGQTITSLGTQGKPSPGQLSMVMRLQRSGDRWLVNKLNSPLVQPPQS
ncbi:hypothetical protein [Nocardia jejuensis]|uniref:hypothetical protein n=1 Tax=Nocardia jejuensis TaxID=328049 RepID=UPI00083397C8|nr:hypothetical protein [Nocardia jejuensis]